MKNKKILIIDHDIEAGGVLRKALTDAGYHAENALNGIEGIKMATSHIYQMILLDLSLPYKSGEEVLRRIREVSDVPVIIISAKDLVCIKIELFRLGADDFVSKPFGVDEIVARVDAILRRFTMSCRFKRTLHYQDIMIDCEAKRVLVSGKELSITAMEYVILELLISHPDRIFSKQNLFEVVIGEGYLGDDNTITVHMSNIRQKLRSAGKSDTYIETVYRMGYRLKKKPLAARAHA